MIFNKQLLNSTIRFYFAKSRFESFRDIKINKADLQTSFMRSSGPGGQSVNKTNSKAQMKLKLEDS